MVRVLVSERSRLVAYIFSVVRDRDLAEDVYQELCLAAVSNRATLADESHLKGWVWTGARTRSVDALRRAGKRPRLFDDKLQAMIGEEWRHEPVAGAEAMHEALERCLASLSPYSRQLVDKRYREGLTGSRLADAVGKKLNTVYVALSRTHATLADCVRHRLNGETDA